jgi:hypothetical protein
MITVGGTITETLADIQPRLEAIFDALKVLWDADNDPLTIRNVLFDVTGTLWPDFKLTGAFFNGGDLGINAGSRIDIIISGPYGSHLDSELVFISYDTSDGKVFTSVNNFTQISTLARVIMFIEEMVTYTAGLSAFPSDTVTVLKL